MIKPEKPVGMRIKELQENLDKVITGSNLPAFVIIPIVYDLECALRNIQKDYDEKERKEYEEKMKIYEDVTTEKEANPHG